MHKQVNFNIPITPFEGEMKVKIEGDGEILEIIPVDNGLFYGDINIYITYQLNESEPKIPIIKYIYCAWSKAHIKFYKDGGMAECDGADVLNYDDSHEDEAEGICAQCVNREPETDEHKEEAKARVLEAENAELRVKLNQYKED